MSTDGTQNQISGGDAHTVIQAGTTGPIQVGSGDQFNGVQLNGDNINFVSGDNHGGIHQTFNRR
ncbi:hypothetical protein ACFWMG_04775 [Streptomyces sp. NPDC127074]|uniref:hypothetical protein n=1 Tax=Streptomyces sp. NPDC127074 TaxID=3347130 RepID=UPI003665229F